MSHTKPNGNPVPDAEDKGDYCRHCGEQPCRCKSKEDKMDAKRMERMEG